MSQRSPLVLLLLAVLALAPLALVACNGPRGVKHTRTAGVTGRNALPARLEKLPPPPPAPAPEPFRTQQFETAEIPLATADNRRLEATLQDLNRRKDFDATQSGSDAAYLNEWVEKVTAELKRRGYYVDAQGQLRRPGAVVPWR